MDAIEGDTIAAVLRFNDAINNQNLTLILESVTEDHIFENTYPTPDGTRYEGREVVRGFWEAFFRASLQARFETEEIFAAGDRCIVRWKYYWTNEKGESDHIRGVDIFRVHAGKVAEKLSYVKG